MCRVLSTAGRKAGFLGSAGFERACSASCTQIDGLLANIIWGGFVLIFFLPFLGVGGRESSLCSYQI